MKGYYDSNFNITYVLTHKVFDYSLDNLLKESHASIWGDMIKSLDGGYVELIYTVGKKL